VWGHREIHIDWFQNDEKILAFFKDWLKKERPDSFAVYNSRGKRRIGDSVLRASLKALVAFDLLRLRPQGLTKKAALKATTTKDKLGMDFPMYSNGASMTRAQEIAINRIESISPEFVVFQHQSEPGVPSVNLGENPPGENQVAVLQIGRSIRLWRGRA
jgi:hypothetical protein